MAWIRPDSRKSVSLMGIAGRFRISSACMNAAPKSGFVLLQSRMYQPVNVQMHDNGAPGIPMKP
jgi:hypothetical protein